VTREHNKKVRRIAPRPRNAPKQLDDGMQHFIVSVPRQAEPIVDQAVRERVAGTIEAGIHPQRFTDIEEAPKSFSTPDPAQLAASMKRIAEADADDKEKALAAGQAVPLAANPADLQAAMRKVTAGEPLDQPPSITPDYGAWFQPIEHCSAPPVGATGQEYEVAELKPVMNGEGTIGDARPNDEGWEKALYAVAYWLVTWFGGGCLVGIGIVTGVRAALRWWFGD
jgi:hypothetical protein